MLNRTKKIPLLEFYLYRGEVKEYKISTSSPDLWEIVFFQSYYRNKDVPTGPMISILDYSMIQCDLLNSQIYPEYLQVRPWNMDLF